MLTNSAKSITDAVLEQRTRMQRKKDVNVGFQSVQVVKHLYVLMVLVKTTSNAILFLIMLPHALSLHAITFIKHQSKSKGLTKGKKNASFTNCQEAAKGNWRKLDKGMSDREHLDFYRTNNKLTTEENLFRQSCT